MGDAPWWIEACGAKPTARPKGWEVQRYPKCTRGREHPGDHAEIDRRTFAVKARWPRA